MKSTPALLPGKSHGRRSLIGYSLWGREESDTTERLHFTSIKLKIRFLNRECLRVLKIFLFPTCFACWHLPQTQTELINHTGLIYRTPPLLQVVEWTEKGPIVLTNDSIYMLSPWSLKRPSHPEEDRKLISL